MTESISHEKLFIEWLLDKLPMSKYEATYSGAWAMGRSPLTVDRYLKKLTSALGPLKEIRDSTSGKIILVKK